MFRALVVAIVLLCTLSAAGEQTEDDGWFSPHQREFEIRDEDPNWLAGMLCILVPEANYSIEGSLIRAQGSRGALCQVEELLWEFNAPIKGRYLVARLFEVDQAGAKKLRLSYPRTTVESEPAGAWMMHYPVGCDVTKMLGFLVGQGHARQIGSRHVELFERSGTASFGLADTLELEVALRRENDKLRVDFQAVSERGVARGEMSLPAGNDFFVGGLLEPTSFGQVLLVLSPGNIYAERSDGHSISRGRSLGR